MPALPPPTDRIRVLLDREPEPRRRHVLYWMTAQRRTRSNHALDRAVAWAKALDTPLLILEALGVGYEHASDRLHAFVVQGMQDNAAACRAAGVRYLRYVEPARDAGRGLVRALAAEAAVVITDDHPCHPYPALIAAAQPQIDCRFEAVDGCGVMPIHATPKAFATAYAFRRFLQKELPARLDDRPDEEPLKRLRSMRSARVSRKTLERWPELRDDPSSEAGIDLGALPINHGVTEVEIPGGAVAARARAKSFLAGDLEKYTDERNHPDSRCESGLSPYLHFGHLGAFELVAAVLDRAAWEPSDLSTDTRGKRTGWWGVPEASEAFLDQVITWRELGFNTCVHRPDVYMDLASLPDFATRTLAKHVGDERPTLYDLDTLERAETHDEVWNAGQTQLVREGTMHNYLRMLWGKKILEWSPTPEEALAHMIYLNDKYALDGRDPNSYSGILWCLGRHDRAWGPERPIFGTVRYMSSDNTKRKLRIKQYLARYAPPTEASA